MTRTLPPQAWLTRPETTAVMDALAGAGGADCARFVGGCVRNALLRKPVKDVDIATRLTPDQVIGAIEAAGLKAVPTGLAYGTITAVCGSIAYEITTLRRDVETDGRHATVAFTDDWVVDAGRRDFRINALYADAEGRVFDPTGAGLTDLDAGAIVFVGDAQTRIGEDALRILRFFRFHAWYGRGEADPQGLAACHTLAGLIDHLSAERVCKEFLTLMGADDPRGAVALMAQTGVLTRILPQTQGRSRFDALVEIETSLLFTDDPLLRLAALLPDDPAVGAATAERLRLSNSQRDRLTKALTTTPPLASWMGPRETRKAVYALGSQTFADRTLLAWAGSKRPAAASQWRALLPLGQSWTAPRLPITGEEVMAAGVPAGPLVGEVMREVERWWIDNDFISDKLSIIERLKAVAQGMAY